MPEITIMITDKIAEVKGTPIIVCGNADYTVIFETDEEWSSYSIKTARFNYTQNGVRLHQDVQFTGDRCAVPVMTDVYAVEIGLYAGDIRTSTLARIPCERCATDDAAQHPEPMPDVYDQLLSYLENYTPATSAPFAFSDVQAVSAGGVSEDIFAIAEEVS